MGALPLADQPARSEEFAGKYRLIAELGQGGMARVFLAVAQGADAKFRKLAVVKLLRPEFAIDPDFNEMFLEEARLCARLNHSNIVQTYDVGVEAGRHLIAMEFLHGVSMYAALAKLGREGGALNAVYQASILLKVLEGLRYAHELKDYDGRSLEIVHRDVSPHNIFLTYDGQVKLLDFGIAKAATSQVHTATGVIKGKLTYMAPEQALGVPVDPRADLYPVGVMLWQAITGRRRWPIGTNEAVILTRLASGEPPQSPGSASRGLPAELDTVVCRALAPNREHRFRDAGEFIDALEAVLRTLPPVSPRALGTMLCEAFAEDRRRLQDVIEQQFRLLETGKVPEPHLLPTLPPPRGSGSNEMQLPADPPGSSNAIAMDVSNSRVTGSARTAQSDTGPRKNRVLAVAGAAGVVCLGVLAFVLGGAVSRRPTEVAAAASSGTAASAPATSLPRPPPDAVATAEANGLAQSAATAASVSAATQHEAHATEIERGHTAVGRGSSRSASPPAESVSSVQAGQASAPPPKGDQGLNGLIQRPPETPKVKLERDNPWN